MRTRLAVACFGLLAALAFLGVTATGADMLTGTWRLNVAKSKYSPGPAPQSNTIKIESVEGGLKLVGDGVDSQGRKTHNLYTAKFDGSTLPHQRNARHKTEPQRSRYGFVEKNRRLYLRGHEQAQGKDTDRCAARDFQRRQDPHGHHHWHERSGPKGEQHDGV